MYSLQAKLVFCNTSVLSLGNNVMLQYPLLKLMGMHVQWFDSNLVTEMEWLYSWWGSYQKRWWRSSIRRNEHSSHQAVLIYVTLGMMLLPNLFLRSAYKSAFKILAWWILCMELPYLERLRADTLPTIHPITLVAVYQKPGASQLAVVGPFYKGTDRSSSVGLSEIQGICSQCITAKIQDCLLSILCTSQQTQGHMFIRFFIIITYTMFFIAFQ